MVPTVLMATLGGKAQLITLALDCLREQGIIPETTLVFHTRRDRTQTANALAKLKADAIHNPNTPPYQFLELQGPNGVLEDITAPSELDIAFQFIYREVRKAKLNGETIHFLMAGGRRTLTVFSMAVAQMLFDDSDRLWHIASHPQLEESARLHAKTDEWVRLIHIPVIPWGRLSPAFAALRDVNDPFEALEQLNHLRWHEQWDAARIFILSHLSTAEKSVVELLARDGLNQSDIADNLSLSPRTVEQHLRSAYRKAADYWELEHVNQAQLVRLLNLYFSTNQ